MGRGRGITTARRPERRVGVGKKKNRTRYRRPLLGAAVLQRVAVALQRLGFQLSFANSEKSSFYFKQRYTPFKLRVSDHPWSGGARQRHLEVVHNVIVPAALFENEADELAFTAALRFVVRCRQRMGLLGKASAEEAAP